MLHHYFSDKIELITYCVRQYKAECVTRYDNIVVTVGSADELRRSFGAAMAATLALIRHLSGSAGAARDLEENVQRVLESLMIRG